MMFGFGAFELDLDVPELRRNGFPVQIEPQVFALLGVLIENRDRIVSKDELIDAVWGGRIVSDATITSRINLVRKAVDDDGREQAVIRTFPKRGWRFVADINAPEPRPELERSASAPTWMQSQATILVLPFEDQTAGGSEFLAEGLTDDLIVALSRHADVSVIAMNTAMKIAAQSGRLENPLARVEADYLVTGSVRTSGERLRVTVQLAERATGNTIWSERFDRQLEDIFEVQDNIVEALAGCLPWRVLAREGARYAAGPPTQLSSYQAYLKVSWKTDELSIEEEVAAYREIVEADPDFAQARAELGFTLAYKGFATGRNSPIERAKSLEHARAAIRLAPANERVLSKAAMTFQFSGHFDLAMRHSQQAIEINPHSTDCTHYRGTVLSGVGLASEALTCHRRTMALDPLFPQWHFEGMMEAHYLLEQYAEALDLFSRWSAPTAHVHAYAAACHAHMGNLDAAREGVVAFEAAMPVGASNFDFVEALLRCHARQVDRKNWLDGFRAAGLPGLDGLA